MKDRANPRPLLETLDEALSLKALDRAGWRRVGVKRPESVAAHSWGVAWLVLVLCPESLDRGRALAIATVHDLAEARTGDITPHDPISRDVKRRREERALEELLAPLAGGDELRRLWREMEEGLTPEGRFVRDCDRLDMALQARRYAAEQGVDTSEHVESALREIDDELLLRLADPSRADR